MPEYTVTWKTAGAFHTQTVWARNSADAYAKTAGRYEPHVSEAEARLVGGEPGEATEVRGDERQ